MKPTKSNVSLLTGAAITFIVLAGSLQAAVIFNVSDTGPARNDTTPPATNLAGASVTSSVAGAPGSVSYTLTNVDLTSIGGTSTDQIVFLVTFSTSTTGGSLGSIAANGNIFTASPLDNPLAPNQIHPGENLTATLTLTSTTFSGGLGNLSAGFTSTTIGGVTNAPDLESWNIVHDTGTQSGSGTAQSTQALPSSSFLRIQDVATTSANAGVNLAGYTVTLTAIPEPGAAFLGAFGFLSLLRRRR